MPVYILRLPSSEFTGVMAGVDFFQGKGSTSSLADAHVLAQIKNCGVARLEADGTETPIAVKRTEKEHLAPVFEAVASAGPDPKPVQSNGGGVEASAPPASLSESQAALKAAEDNPDSPGQKALAEKVRAKAHRGNRGRRR